MCGIAGIVDYRNSTGANNNIYESMLSSMEHRGPDDEGIYISSPAVLLHKRLAVIDPLTSKQPMTICSNGEIYTIVYNGEIYNTDELRQSLTSLGYTFKTRGDTETVLLSYIHYKEKCVDMFNGIFAFAVWCEKAQTLFFARDMMGVKPFFYSFSKGFFIFASTVPTILLHPEIKPRIDALSVGEILLLGPGRLPHSGIFKDIHALPRGYRGTFSASGLSTEEYFTLKDKPHTDSFEETARRVNFLVTDAIKRQLVSDVPIGTFLSGGLDSSIITAIAADHMKAMGKALDTFSVTYKDNEKHFKSSHFQPDSDEKYINLMVHTLNTNHHEVVLDTDDVIRALYLIVEEKGLPAMADVDSSLLLFCKKIKETVTVSLSGECADEIFGGYPWYRDELIRNMTAFPWAQNTNYRSEFISEGLKDKIPPDYVLEKYKEAIKNVSAETDDPTEKRMREMFVLNTDHFMQTLLFRKDSASMHASLEVRVPFCDKRIAEYLYCVPWEFKNYQNREKGLLRHAFEGVLPHEILWRKKSPYPKTHNPEYLSRLREIFASILADKDNPLWDILNREKSSSLLSEETSTPWYGQLMTTPQTIAYFIQLEYWIRKFSVTLI